MTQTDVSTQIEPPGQWNQGWGFQYQGDLNNPTATRPDPPRGSNPNEAPGTTTPATGTTEADKSARAIIDGFLGSYGLTSLSQWAWDKFKSGVPIDQINLELRETPEYQARFPAMKQLGQEGRAISESQYIGLEKTYQTLARQYGLPQGFYDSPDDFAKLIAGNVAPTEYENRLQDYQAVAYNVDPTIREELQRLYGVDAGHLTAFFIDEQKALPLLTRQFGATQAAAQSRVSGFGALDQAQAESIGPQSQEALQRGFGTLYAQRELLGTLPGEGGVGIGTQGGLDAAFRGDAAAQDALERRARARRAALNSGGGVAQTQQGFAGAG